MRDDPRLLRVIRRYPKGERFWDAKIDLSGIDIADIRAAFRAEVSDRDVRPRLLDDFAMRFFSTKWPGAFDSSRYDYFMHIYARREFESDLKELGVPSEDGPPSYIPLDPLLRWISVRPEDEGFEAYEGVPKE